MCRWRGWTFRALDLKSGGAEFQPRPNHLPDLFSTLHASPKFKSPATLFISAINTAVGKLENPLLTPMVIFFFW